MTTTVWTSLDSPIGRLELVAADGALCGVHLPEQRWAAGGQPSSGEERADEPVLLLAREQLGEYFAGVRRSFTVPLRQVGTEFQRAVWSALMEIGFGETRSYAELARALERPSATRAVGAANGRNPLAILVPCHRVIGSDRSLTGYAGGLARKKWLLEHEARLVRARAAG